MSLLLIRFGEIALKGKNRGFFEKSLTDNIRRSLRGIDGCHVHRTYGRNFVEVSEEENVPLVIDRLQKVFGIISLSPVTVTELDIESIKKAATDDLAKLVFPGLRFKVQTKRANKRFPLTSLEVSSEIGAHLLNALPGLVVDVNQPETIVDVDIREDNAYTFTRRIPGPGGLPVGVAGKGLLLLSGGLDSPVAGWMAMKRGVKLEALHFHSFPFTSDRAREKVIHLSKVLSLYNGRTLLHIAHFTEIQKQLKLKCPGRLSVTLMRRMMLRIAGRLAEKRGALAIFTGENLGQVASQTIESIAVIENVRTLPILRPLITFDKSEIVIISKRIETYDISIRPYEDCCTIFLPEYPAIRPGLDEVEEAESALDIEMLVGECLEEIETIQINPGKEI